MDQCHGKPGIPYHYREKGNHDLVENNQSGFISFVVNHKIQLYKCPVNYEKSSSLQTPIGVKSKCNIYHAK